MDPEWIDIQDYRGAGYLPLVSFEAWRVAVLRFADEARPDQVDNMERHNFTDEVFVLVDGQAVLLLGGNGSQVDDITPVPMEKGVVYNIKKAAWHNVVMSRDAHILIVENDDTGDDNSEFCPLNSDQKVIIKRIAVL